MAHTIIDWTTKKITSISLGSTVEIFVTFIVCARPNVKNYEITHVLVRNYHIHTPVWHWPIRIRKRTVKKSFRAMKHCETSQSAGPPFRWVNTIMKWMIVDTIFLEYFIFFIFPAIFVRCLCPEMWTDKESRYGLSAIARDVPHHTGTVPYTVQYQLFPEVSYVQ